MSKNNSRSFRFSNETLFYLESFEGSSLSEKFENVILLSYRNKLSLIKSLDLQKAELEKLRNQCDTKRRELVSLVELDRYKGTLMLSMGDLMQKLRSFSDNLDREM